MGMFGGIDASASGLTAERLRMDVISNNLANANTVGAPGTDRAYRRRYVVFEPRELSGSGFDGLLAGAMRGNKKARKAGNGVRAVRIEEDRQPGPLVYDPGNPLADEQGYVERPNINAVTEMVDLISASRAYEANVTALNAAKSMASKAMDIGRG